MLFSSDGAAESDCDRKVWRFNYTIELDDVGD